MNDENQEQRKTYTRPEIRRVTLKPEEALVAACKTISMSAPAGTPCNVNTCSALGS